MRMPPMIVFFAASTRGKARTTDEQETERGRCRAVRGHAGRNGDGAEIAHHAAAPFGASGGIFAGDMGNELDIPSSTLSHHLEKLKNEKLVSVRRESTFLRYTANTRALKELLGFLYAECCTRNQAIEPEAIINIA